MSEIKLVRKEKKNYLVELEEKWERWTGIKDDDAKEAINHLSGNLSTSIGKFQSVVCTMIETHPSIDKDVREGLRDKIKSLVSELLWRDIIEYQKVGMDKLCITIRKHLKEEPAE